MLSKTETFRRAVVTVLAVIALIAIARSASACPSCPSALVTRAQIFDEGFFRNLAVAVLPFLLIGAVCVRVQEIGRPRG